MEEQLKFEIKSTIEKYKRAKSLSARNYYYNSICCLIDIYQNLTKGFYPFSPRIKDIIYCNYQEKNKYKTLFSKLSAPSYRNMIQQLSSNGIAMIEDNIQLEEQEFHIRINYKDACTIIYSFFEKYDIKLLSFVKYILENNVIFCSAELEKLGYSNNIKCLKKSYIVLFADKEKMNIEILVTLIHEIGHVIYNQNTYNKQKTSEYNNFLEVLPYFLEQTFIEFCFKNNIYTLEGLKAQKNDIIGLYNYLIELRIVNKFIKKLNLKTLAVKLNSSELNKVEDFNFVNESIIFEECDLNYLYTYGIALGFYYFKLYKQDPEKANEYIKKFILNIGTYNDIYILSHYGINYDEFISCNFLQPIIKENEKRLNKNTQI